MTDRNISPPKKYASPQPHERWPILRFFVLPNEQHGTGRVAEQVL